jgi:hypothetical protein
MPLDVKTKHPFVPQKSCPHCNNVITTYVPLGSSNDKLTPFIQSAVCSNCKKTYYVILADQITSDYSLVTGKPNGSSSTARCSRCWRRCAKDLMYARFWQEQKFGGNPYQIGNPTLWYSIKHEVKLCPGCTIAWDRNPNMERSNYKMIRFLVGVVVVACSAIVLYLVFLLLDQLLPFGGKRAR